MTTEQMDWIDDQINAGKMKPRGQPWELVGTCDWGDHLAQFKADQLDAWERRLAQFSNRSDSTGYVGRIGVEVLTELRQTREQAEALATRAEQAEARETALKAAILDIDAHAAPFGEDADGFVTGGYIISTGCLHRALGVVGHSSRKCTP